MSFKYGRFRSATEKSISTGRHVISYDIIICYDVMIIYFEMMIYLINF